MVKKYITVTLVIVAGVMMLSLQGCATIFGSKTNSLVFTGDTVLAAKVYIDGVEIGEANGKLKVSREVIQHGSTLEIKKEGYETEEYLILRKPHAGLTVANFLVGVIPLGVDMATGNLYRPEPRKFEVELKEKR